MLVEVDHLRKDYASGLLKKNVVRAVDDVSFSIAEGETLGLVGESGCGKSTVARLLLLLVRPLSGSIRFNGAELREMSPDRIRKLRKDMQIIFQHPQQSLNPRLKIYESMAEPLRLHRLAGSKAEEKKRVLKLLEDVGLAEEHLERYPHEISGGQAQRVAIARALSLSPRFLVADEPTSMLDVSVQAQIIALLKKLQKEYDIGMLFISHDLEIVQAVSDRIAVMHKGKIVESGGREQIFTQPVHPYTKFLTSVILDTP
jgi:ABC-type oligopeptide transport system ATPase subunit